MFDSLKQLFSGGTSPKRADDLVPGRVSESAHNAAGLKNPKISDYTVRRVETTDHRDQRLDNVDFSDQRIDHLRFFDCTLTGCSFDHATCRDIRMWGTTLRDCTFRGADIRDSGLGSAHGGKFNRFEGVLFEGTDMRRTAYQSAVFTDCRFDHADLAKVDFQGSRFTRCTFSGLLREVLFYDHCFRGEALEANRMEDVDFSGAQLRWVQFRGLDLGTVVLPSDEDHIIISNYPAFLDYALRELEGATNLPDKVLFVRLQSERKWLGPRRTTGVLNRLDFLERPEGNEVLARLNDLLASISGSDAQNQPPSYT
jgi:uncharacterized protein YjbI with pentapeptide repeats